MLTLLLACASSDPAPPSKPAVDAPKAAVSPTRVRVALNWYPEPEFGGFYEAALSGLYKNANLEVEIMPGGPGVPVLEMLQAGRIEVAISGADDLLVKRAKGLDAVAVWASFQHSPVGLMAHADGPKTYDEVTGPVAIEAGSPFQRYLWASKGWDGKVQMVPTTGSLGPFAADPKLVQQAYITSEPCVAEGKGLKINFLPSSDIGWDPYAGLVIVAGKDQAAPWLKDFVVATRAGWEAYLKDPTGANAEIVRLNPQMPAAQMGCIEQKQRPFVIGAGLGAMTAARWEAAAAALSSAGEPVKTDGAWLSL